MKISGFTMGKNVSRLYYPIREAIESILPICDEFIVALGDCDDDDNTREEILNIGSDKIKIIDTVWDLKKYPQGMEHAHQTDLAMEACSGDWLFYVQSDEVVHEKYLPLIKSKCEEFLDDTDVEGLLFNYKHFWGDYDHYFKSRGWYGQEIRVVRNLPDTHSFWSAQSFRKIPNFNGLDYREKEGTFKLKVAEIDAYIYHYGWVRPPIFMTAKQKAFNTIHFGKAKADELDKATEREFNYGNLKNILEFKETHPRVMQRWIDKFDWGDKLYNPKPDKLRRHKWKHEKIKYKFLEWMEDTFNGGKQIIGYTNWKKIR